MVEGWNAIKALSVFCSQINQIGEYRTLQGKPFTSHPSSHCNPSSATQQPPPGERHSVRRPRSSGHSVRLGLIKPCLDEPNPLPVRLFKSGEELLPQGMRENVSVTP